MVYLHVRFIALALAVLITAPEVSSAKDGVLRVGIIGCDTSHVVDFTKLINNPNATGSLAKVEVTAAFPGGSPDLPISADRIDAFVNELRAMGVEIVDSLEVLANNTDAILLESVDGRPLLEQFRAVAKGRPVFIDKPTAGSLADVFSIFRIADETKTPVFSSSSLRYCKEVQEAAHDKSIGKMVSCDTTGPLDPMPHHPDLFFHGIHGVESLLTIMGKGCESVSRTDTPEAAVVVGKWKDGRVGTYHGLKKKGMYAFTVKGDKGIAERKGFSGYDSAIDEICKFFISRKPPVNRDETIEIYAFMEAADESKRLDGKPVSIGGLIKQAERKSVGTARAKAGAN
jgi:hypothetical protein